MSIEEKVTEIHKMLTDPDTGFAALTKKVDALTAPAPADLGDVETKLGEILDGVNELRSQIDEPAAETASTGG